MNKNKKTYYNDWRLKDVCAYEALRQRVLKVFVGRSLLNPPHAIFVIKEKLALADTRIADVA